MSGAEALVECPVIVGTAGHVDHGKSALIEALTGKNPDRLEVERRRGMTVELGFGELALPSGKIVGLVDVPGHAHYLRAMVQGATGIDVAVLVVSAVEGVMPQLFQCAGCGRELTEEETGELFFSQDEHGILCADCSRMAMDRKRISAAALYAMRYIAVSPLAKLYTFTVRDDVLRELERHIYRYTELNTDKRFKSLEILSLIHI